ncbi:MAG TPA: FGGY-family carbohydrate kinase [Acidimicrobiales bacterium]|nr:FGGY-family carbohydrate kinase [Acidimicrobiales bacterium]
MSGSVTVGLDIGTTATKAVAADADGRVLARARVRHKVRAPQLDQLEHDAVRAWRRGPLQALAEVTASVPEPAGVCVASMVPSLTAVDARGRPITPGLLYTDGRGRQPTADDEDGPDSADVMPDASGFLRWAVGEAPGAFGYWPAQAVANYALGRVPAIDTAMAMMLGSIMVGDQWNMAELDALGVTPSQLPTVVPMGGPAGTVTGTGTVLAGGTVDAFCDQIVSGAERAGDVLVICGATLIVWAVVDEWKEAPGLWTVPHMAPGLFIVGGPSNAGALFVDWARSLIQSSTRASAARPDASPVPARSGDPGRVPVWLPYLRGERAPYNDRRLRASVHDLDITHDATAMERGAYEASGFVVRTMLDRAGIVAKRIVASGGGTRVLPWMAGMADATGLPVDVVGVPEGAALGAAFMARMAAGLETSLDAAGRWASVGERIEPDPVWQAAATERYARFSALRPQV